MPGRDPSTVLLSMQSGGSSLPHSSSHSSSDGPSRWGLPFVGGPARSYGDIAVTGTNGNRAIHLLVDAPGESESHSYSDSVEQRAQVNFTPAPQQLQGFVRRPSRSNDPPVTFSGTGESIRDYTALLSDMLLSPSPSLPPIQQFSSFPDRVNIISPGTGFPRRVPSRAGLGTPSVTAPGNETSYGAGSSVGGLRRGSSSSGEVTPRVMSPNASNRSMLTMLLARDARERIDAATSVDPVRPQPPLVQVSSPSPPYDDKPPESLEDVPTVSSVRSRASFLFNDAPSREATSSPPHTIDRAKLPDEEEGLGAETGSVSSTIRTPLLAYARSPEALTYGTSVVSSGTPPYHHYITIVPEGEAHASTYVRTVEALKSRVKVAREYASPKAAWDGVLITVALIPSVLLGLLLNVLDGVSYGFIIFPAGPIFAGFGSLGVSMFFVTTVLSQLVYSLGGSSFPGATGSMIIEVIPFFQLITTKIMSILGEENPKQVVATTMVAFAFSSILTGLTFLLLGMLRLGSVIGFFPRHILVGCIGGVGVFLIQTGLNVSAGMGEEAAELSWRMLKLYFTDAHVLTLWVPAFALAVLLRVITHNFHHQLIFPIYFVALPIVFYIIVGVGGWDLNQLRASGWIFDVGTSSEPWYKFYSYFDFYETSWRAIWATMPTQLALLFFNILHPPLNVPALGFSLGKDDVDLNLELTGHGVSNLVAGCFGVPSNYLAYVNTLLFYRVGGTTRYSGLLLAFATAGLLFIGTGPIAYIPVIEVGALIFVLGIDLVVEAVWDTRHKASVPEYVTIIGIMAVMTVYDFVSGVIFGLIVASIFFVIQNSRLQSIRNTFSGSTALSNVRRPSAQRRYLQEVGIQTCIVRLQGFLFFGTISGVEEKCRAYLEAATWEKNPIRFLIIDLTLVNGIDLSAAEAFVRLHRLLEARRVQLVFCGQLATSDVAKALQAVNLWHGNAEVFATLNEALEWTENAYIRLWYGSLAQKQENATNIPINVRDDHVDMPSLLSESFVNSPRRTHVQAVGSKIMETATGFQETLHRNEQPFNTIIKTFSGHIDLDHGFVSRISPYLKPLIVEPGKVIFHQGDIADGLYLVESGVLRATYVLGEHVDVVEESCVAGTLAGELTALAGEPRNATIVAERQSVLWKMESAALARLEKEHPEDAQQFIKLVLRSSKVDQDVLLASLAQLR